MTFLILFILAVVWAVYLASWLRSRNESSRSNSISSFARHLSTLERATPRTGIAIAPRSRPYPGSASFAPARPSLSTVKQRRRTVLFSLSGATAVLMLASLVAGGVFTTLFALGLVLTGAYVVLLANAQKRVLERRAKVRHLPTAGGARADRVDFFAEDRADEFELDTAASIRAVGSR